jgi:hypothetical protein
MILGEKEGCFLLLSRDLRISMICLGRLLDRFQKGF